MQLDRPLRVVGPSIDGDVLFVLARVDAEFTPPQVQSLLDEHSVDGIRKAMRRLAGQGIVTHRRAGNAVFYRLNREHLAAPAIEQLAEQKHLLLARLRERIATWTSPPRFASLFGSAAAGTMRPESDIDLLVVRDNDIDVDDDAWSDQLADLEADVTSWTGNDARILELAHQEVVTGLAQNDRVLLDISAVGIPLAGPTNYLTATRHEHR